MAMDVAHHNARSPYRNLHFYFALLIPGAVLGFGPFLFNGVTLSGRPLTPIVQMHGALMGLWLVMLTAQAWFIRTNRFQIHQWVGRSSYVIAPAIILSVLVTGHESFNQAPEGVNAEFARQFVFDTGMNLAFAVTWGLAILYRKRTPLHVRYMISTAFAISTAIVFRIIFNWFTWLPGLVQDPPGGILAATWAVLTLLLLALIAMDWRMGIKRSPFWVVTILIGVMNLGYWTYGKTDGWLTFCRWFADLPLRGS